jgi:hypothetical protein
MVEAGVWTGSVADVADASALTICTALISKVQFEFGKKHGGPVHVVVIRIQD